jgi:hypothetical protein
LTIEPVHEVAQVCGLDRFVGDHGETCAALDLAQQRRQIATGLRVVAGLADQRGGDRSVAALGCENNSPLG